MPTTGDARRPSVRRCGSSSISNAGSRAVSGAVHWRRRRVRRESVRICPRSFWPVSVSTHGSAGGGLIRRRGCSWCRSSPGKARRRFVGGRAATDRAGDGSPAYYGRRRPRRPAATPTAGNRSRPGREALRRQAEHLGELAREDLVADHEYQLQDVRLGEVLPNSREACVRDLTVIADNFLSELERGLLAAAEMVTRPPVA